MKNETKTCGCVYKKGVPSELCLRHESLRKDLRGFVPKGSVLATVRMGYTDQGPVYGVIAIVNNIPYNKTGRIGDLISHHVRRDRQGHIGFHRKSVKPTFIAECVGLMLYGDPKAVLPRVFDNL